MKRILVQPAHKDLIVLDDLSRRIPYKEEGAWVNRTPLIGRLIKDKDLVVLKATKKTTKKEG